MTFDPSRAAQSQTAPRSAGSERPVVVPLHPRLLGSRPVAASQTPRPSGVVAQIGDYLNPPARPVRPSTPAPAPRPRQVPPAVKAHAAEIESLLRDHLHAQLSLLADQAPELRGSLDTIRRSIDVLLRLPRG